jgi:hypothetical protein
MVAQFQSLLEKFGLLHWVITFAKDENTDLATMAATLHFIINCEPFKIFRVYEFFKRGHVMFKAC